MILEERPVVLHQGTYKRTATVAEAVFMITGLMIGAGVLGLPYAVAQVGLPVGLMLIVGLGLITLVLHLVLGEIAVRTNQPMQLPGFAGKYLGRIGKWIVSFTMILRSYGALLAYLVGVGAVLAVLFGGQAAVWSVFFWSVLSFVIWSGLQRVKKVEKVLSLTVMVIISGLAFYLLPKFSVANAAALAPGSLLMAAGVILFALSATPAVAEAHALLPGSERRFRKALIIGTLVPIGLYIIFATAVVGALGANVSEVATAALSHNFGAGVAIFANLFAVLAMSTAYVALGNALKESLIWDFKISKPLAVLLVALIPLALFSLGARGFVTILEVIGGVFIALENIILILVYFKAKKSGDIEPARYRLPYFGIFAGFVLLFFSLVAGFSAYALLVRIWQFAL